MHWHWMLLCIAIIRSKRVNVSRASPRFVLQRHLRGRWARRGSGLMYVEIYRSGRGVREGDGVPLESEARR